MVETVLPRLAFRRMWLWTMKNADKAVKPKDI